MGKYRKIAEIEAFRFGYDESPDWFKNAVDSHKIKNFTGYLSGDRSRLFCCCHIKTLEGTMEATAGDWIIKGIQGEIYPCKDDIFQQTYEKVE